MYHHFSLVAVGKLPACMRRATTLEIAGRDIYYCEHHN
jgi:hypothetical protein